MVRDLEGRVMIVTGANTGIGKVSAEKLAARGAKVWLGCRSEEKARPVLDGIKAAGGDAHFLPLDLSDFDSVRAAAKTFLASGDALHVLLNNAGLASTRGVTKQGFELAFGTNHLGHFLLTTLLLDKIVATGAVTPARIVNVSSKSHYDTKGLDFDKLRQSTPSVTGMKEYSDSKLANVLFTKELARRLDATKVTTYALHPGVVATDAWRRMPQPFRWLIKTMMMSAEDGANTSLYCATSPDCAKETGLYYDKSAPRKPNPVADDVELQQRLWTESERWVASA